MEMQGVMVYYTHLYATHSCPFSPPSKVFDLTPLAALRALQSLDCGGCQAVQQLAPLAALTALQSLLCRGTRVADLGPLTALMALQKLDCSWTAIIDLRPLAGRVRRWE